MAQKPAPTFPNHTSAISRGAAAFQMSEDEWATFLSTDFFDDEKMLGQESIPVTSNTSVMEKAGGMMFNILVNYFGKK